MTVALDAPMELHPQVALRPEPFSALAYHYGNHHLVFLKSPDVLAVMRALDEHPTVADALSTYGMEERRWPAFVAALDSLEHSEVVRGR